MVEGKKGAGRGEGHYSCIFIYSFENGRKGVLALVERVMGIIIEWFRGMVELKRISTFKFCFCWIIAELFCG